MNTILFVCTGNTCRSSMASGLFKKIIYEDKRLKDIEIISAGTNVCFPTGASIDAIKVGQDMGFDISNHVSSQITEELINKADLILTMTQRHKSIIISMNEKVKEKVFTLKEFVNGSDINEKDIIDPFGMGFDEYKKCALEINQFLILAKDKIKEMEG